MKAPPPVKNVFYFFVCHSFKKKKKNWAYNYLLYAFPMYLSCIN